MRCKFSPHSVHMKVATATLAATMAFLPFKAAAEEPNSSNGSGAKRSVATQIFYQDRKDTGHETGLGLDTEIQIKPLALGFGTSVSGNLEHGNMTLERATANATVSLPHNLAVTGYAQRNRFLGGQRAVGGALHADLGAITLHTGAEYDLIGKVIPIFVGMDIPLGQLIISPTLIVPIVPEREYPNLGGTVKLSLKTKAVNFFVQIFGMFEPKTKTALAENVQIGVEVPIGGAEK